jgi:hypothetical protein
MKVCVLYDTYAPEWAPSEDSFLSVFIGLVYGRGGGRTEDSGVGQQDVLYQGVRPRRDTITAKNRLTSCTLLPPSRTCHTGPDGTETCYSLFPLHRVGL